MDGGPVMTEWEKAANAAEMEVLALLSSGHAAYLLKEPNAREIMSHFIQKADSFLQNEIPYPWLARMYYRLLWEMASTMAAAAVTPPDYVTSIEESTNDDA